MVHSFKNAVAVVILVGSFAVCPVSNALAAKKIAVSVKKEVAKKEVVKKNVPKKEIVKKQLVKQEVAQRVVERKDVYDIIYMLSSDLEKVLDYKEDLESVFDSNISTKLKIVGRGDEYGLIYDGNLNSRTVAKTLIEHAELLNAAGFDEPYSIREEKYAILYNVSYGMGPNLEPLKKKYQILYSRLGEAVKRDLFVEQTDFGNYVLVYRMRGDEASANRVAKQHADLLKNQKITTSLVRENNNTVVYGESSLIDDGVSGPQVCPTPGSLAIPVVAQKAQSKETQQVEQLKLVAKPKVEKDVAAYSKIGGNSSFEQSIESHIASLRNKGIIDGEESMGWMVYDLEQDKNIVSINGDMNFQAASMIKPFVALAYFHLVNENKITYDSQARRKLEAMIQRSSNSATNWTMKQVGGPAQCDAILKKYYGNILKKTEVREYIPADGRTYLNSAPPSDYVRYLRALWNQELPYSKEIRRLMALPGRDRLYYGTPLPRGILVYNKTGSTARLCGDMGILVPQTKQGSKYPYAVVGIIERKSSANNYGQWMNSRGNVIRQLSTLVYEELKKEHQLL